MDFRMDFRETVAFISLFKILLNILQLFFFLSILSRAIRAVRAWIVFDCQKLKDWSNKITRLLARRLSRRNVYHGLVLISVLINIAFA